MMKVLPLLSFSVIVLLNIVMSFENGENFSDWKIKRFAETIPTIRGDRTLVNRNNRYGGIVGYSKSTEHKKYSGGRGISESEGHTKMKSDSTVVNRNGRYGFVGYPKPKTHKESVFLGFGGSSGSKKHTQVKKDEIVNTPDGGSIN